jgi:hypothetical protein
VIEAGRVVSVDGVPVEEKEGAAEEARHFAGAVRDASERVPEPGEITRKDYLAGERHNTSDKVAVLNTILGSAVFGYGKQEGTGKPIMFSVVDSLAGLTSLEEAMTVEIAKETNPRIIKILKFAREVVIEDKKELADKKAKSDKK